MTVPPNPPIRRVVISAEDAVDIATRHGLSLTDAAGLRSLARDVDEAERIAQRFATGAESDERSTVTKLFARPERPRRMVANLHEAIDRVNEEGPQPA